MSGETQDEDDYNIRFREDDELEFFTELAVHETERWIQVGVVQEHFLKLIIRLRIY